MLHHCKDHPTESKKEFRKQVWALRNPNKPLPDSDEAKDIKERNKRLEQYSADRKQLMREKKREAVNVVAVPDGEGEEAEEE